MIGESLGRVFDEGGARGVLVRGAKKLFRPVVQGGGLIFFERDLHQPLPACGTVEYVIAREAFVSDLDLFDGMLNAAAYKATALERFHRRNRCFVGIDSATGKLANFRWVTTTTAYIPEIARYIRLQPGEAYIFDLFTLPEFRRRGFDRVVRRWTYNALEASGIDRTVAYICADNFANLRASRRYLKKTGRLWYVQVHGFSPMVFGAKRPGVPDLTSAGACS